MPLRCPFVLWKMTCPDTPASLPARSRASHCHPCPCHPALAFKRSQAAEHRGKARDRSCSWALPDLTHSAYPSARCLRGLRCPLRCTPVPPSPTAPLAGHPPRSPAGTSVPEPRQGQGKALPTLPTLKPLSLGQTPEEPAGPDPAAASNLLGAAQSSSPAAGRGEPRWSALSRGWSCPCASPRKGCRPPPHARLSLPPEPSRRDFYTGGRDPRFDSAEPGLRRGGERREGRRAPGQSERPRCPLV